jgi:uncharacterized membrane protein
MDDVALFMHLIGVLVFVAGIVVAGVAFETGRRRDRPAEVALLLGLSRVGARFVMVGALLVLGFGLWLVHLEDLGYGTGWISASITLLVIALVLGGFGGQRLKQARVLAGELTRRDEPASAELRALLSDRPSLAANYAAALIVVAILALMVFKP